MIASVVFDCDGVLLESADIKTQAFGELFTEYGPDAIDFIRSYHLEHNGISRFTKFAVFYEHWLKRRITLEESNDLNERFSRICLEKILCCPMTPGALECLNTLNPIIPLWVASGAPQDELRYIFKRRNLTRFFEGIFGSPNLKSDILRHVMQELKLAPEQVLLVGDASTDLDAAREVGCQFYGRGAFEGYPRADDLHALAGYVLNRCKP